MNEPPEPVLEEEEAAAAEAQDAEGDGRLPPLSWHLLFKLMLSPMAFLAPCFSCGAAITFAQSFGPIGAMVGAFGGFVLGIGAIFLWYFLITAHPAQRREEAFAEEAIEDAEAGRLGRRLGGPRPPAAEVAAIPLDARPALAVDISGEVEDAGRRVDAHDSALEALAAAEALVADHPRDARAVALLARTLLRAGRPKEGARVAADAFHVAVLKGQMDVVPRLVQSFWEQREELALDPSVAKAVAEHLEAKGQVDRAAYFRSGRSSLL